MTYDGNGNLLTVKDAKNQTTTFAYDDRNRLLSTTDPLGKVETYTYDGNDNLTKRRTPKGDDILFAYDPVNQLLSKTLPGSQITSYQYDLVGNLTNVADPDSVLALTYDLANRLSSVSTAGSSNQPTVTLSYTYDKNGNRLLMTDPVGVNSYTYDALNRLSALISPTGTSGPVCLTTSQTGPISWWPADGNANDLQDGNSGTLQNGATLTSGKVGQAFSLDGVDDFIQVPHHPSLDPGTGSFTVTAWVQTTRATGTQMVVSKYECGQLCISGVSNSLYGLAIQSGRPQAQVRDTDAGGPDPSGDQRVTDTKFVADGTFHYIAMVRDIAANELRLYVDGQMDASAPLIGTNGAIKDDDGEPDPFLIGATIVGGSTTKQGFLAGRIDEVAFYNRALSTTEIQGLNCGDPSSLPLQNATTYTYDALSRRTSVTLPNGTQTIYSYDPASDPASQVTQILHKLQATGAPINQAAYTYNAVGNRTSLTDRRGPKTFGYDALDRLTQATHPLLLIDQMFSYDPVSNRTTNASLYNFV